MGPTDGSDAIVVPSPDPIGDDLAFGSVAPPGAGGSEAAAPGGAAGGSSGGDGRLDDRTSDLLGGRGGDIPPVTRMLVAAISTTTTTTVAMAFFLFGKRRRDGEPPEPDEVLAARAAAFSMAPASTLVPVGADPLGGTRGVGDAGIPRWRRPSLLEARKADPLRSTAVPDRLSFDRGAVLPDANAERRRIRYRNVTLLDAPDELRGAEAGFLDEGDEVQLLQKSGSYWLVLCPNGESGWVHRMVLGDVVTEESRSDAFNAARRSFGGQRVDADTAGAAGGEDPSEGAELDRSIDEDGTDLLSAYLRSRHA